MVDISDNDYKSAQIGESSDNHANYAAPDDIYQKSHISTEFNIADSDNFTKIALEGGAADSSEVVRNPKLGAFYMLCFVWI